MACYDFYSRVSSDDYVKLTLYPVFVKEGTGVMATFFNGSKIPVFKIYLATDNHDLYFDDVNVSYNLWVSDFVNPFTKTVVYANNGSGYPVIFDNFGVRDMKFILSSPDGDVELYMTTDVEVSKPSRPIVFENFEVFNKEDSIDLVKSFVTNEGFYFTDSERDSNCKWTDVLNLSNPISGKDRIRVYDSELYKNGCLDFDEFQKTLQLWKNIKGFNPESSDFTKSLFSSKKNAFYTSTNRPYSLIMFEDKSDLYITLYKNILEQVASSRYLTKNMKSDLDHMLNRWFIAQFSSSKSLIVNLIRLDSIVQKFISAASDVKIDISDYSSKNRDLY